MTAAATELADVGSWVALLAAGGMTLVALAAAAVAVVLWRRTAARLRASRGEAGLLAAALADANRPALTLHADGRGVANPALARRLGVPAGRPLAPERLATALAACGAGVRCPDLPAALAAALPEPAAGLSGSPPHPGGRTASGPPLVFSEVVPLGDGRWLLLADAPSPDDGEEAGPADDGTARDPLLAAWPMPAWRRDADGRLVAVNEAFCRAVGASAQEVLERQIELVGDQLHGDGRTLAMKALASGRAAEDRFFAVLAGARRAVRVIEVPVGGAGSFGIAIDVTEIEDLRAEIAQLERSHAATLDRLTTAVLLFDAERRLTFFNAAFVRMMRLDEDWLAGGPTHGEVLDALRERRRIPEQADYQAWKRAQLDRHRALEGGEELWHLPDETSLRVLTEPHPEGGLLVLFEDVTDRLALERSYNTLIAVQRETLNHLHEAVAVFGPDARLKLFNPAYAEIWGLDAEFLQGEPHFGEMLDRILARLAEHARARADRERILGLKEHLLNQVIAHIPLSGRWHRPDGRVLDYAVVPLPDGRVLTTHVDVTDSVRIEQALRERNEALETADRLKSEFVANMSYELRTPLNTIMGFAELLSHGIAGALSPRQREYLDHVIAAASELKRLIDDILDLATIEAGVFELAVEPVDVPALLETVRQMAKDAARKAGVRLEIAPEPGCGRVAGDRRRLVHAVYNLVRNGIQFTPEGGSVTLFARPESGGVAIGVKDTGIGIGEDERSRVFEKFYRGRGARRRGGTGLGLALVRSFVELHRGRVTIDSEPGRGTTVTIHLPAGTEPDETGGTGAAPERAAEADARGEEPGRP